MKFPNLYSETLAIKLTLDFHFQSRVEHHVDAGVHDVSWPKPEPHVCSHLFPSAPPSTDESTAHTANK